ncbi:MAG: hypothetical protein HYZ58_03540 [Acidobacteria bacterium]|nr:hypothetical protein [Acidobacteriota bacterium]MBI3262207.1 hypothetical protein [Acidobacteriota bacterium]
MSPLAPTAGIHAGGAVGTARVTSAGFPISSPESMTDFHELYTRYGPDVHRLAPFR